MIKRIFHIKNKKDDTNHMSKQALQSKILLMQNSVLKAHELLHQNKHEEAENILHDIICGNTASMQSKTLESGKVQSEMQQFDQEFRMLCTRTKIEAAYVAQVNLMQSDGSIRVSWISGGIGWMSKIIDTIGNKFADEFKTRMIK